MGEGGEGQPLPALSPTRLACTPPSAYAQRPLSCLASPLPKRGCTHCCSVTLPAALPPQHARPRSAQTLPAQGESDAFAPEPAAAYSTNFTAWLDATRSTLQPHHPCVPLVMVVMATRQRELAFPFIHVVRQQQWGLKAPALLKVDMQGFEFYPQDEQQQLIHLTKAGCCALGTSAGFQVAVWQAAGQQQQ